jgi:hypothetical protein
VQHWRGGFAGPGIKGKLRWAPQIRNPLENQKFADVLRDSEVRLKNVAPALANLGIGALDTAAATS